MALLILRQLLGRLAVAVPMLLAVTFGAFMLLYEIGDPAAAMAGEGASREQIEEIRKDNGLDRPIITQYLSWLGHVLQGDLGQSMQHRGDVQALVSQYLPPTLLLSALAMGIAVVAALVAGSLAGMRPDGWLDKALQGVSLLGIAVPNFLVGLILILVFAIWWPLFPAGGYRTPEEVGLFGTLEYLVLPAVALALSLMCLQTRTLRASLRNEYKTDYIRTARMKGASEGQIFLRHAARNASAPLVTVIGLEVGVLITGALLVEVVFAVPGIGTLTIESVRGQDFPVVQALVALFGAVVLLANLLADLVALWLNPLSRSKA
ncbi:ABC transporter permease [Nocardioides alcanivorans]|uniref:ABC transporter permease n=1 Tax=Nocardioides alcanivorans TaxID=2897352 RepID=UPI001F231730|nr:ABC transporter permease [Nocardioides alcanivorans]